MMIILNIIVIIAEMFLLLRYFPNLFIKGMKIEPKLIVIEKEKRKYLSKKTT